MRARVCRGRMASRVFLPRQRSIPLLFCSSPDRRDSREAVRGSADAISWPMARQLSRTVTHPTCNNECGEGKEKKKKEKSHGTPPLDKMSSVTLIYKPLLVHARAPPPTNIPRPQDLKNR